MFTPKYRPKEPLQPDMPTTPSRKSKADLAKQYVKGVAATSQKLIRKHTPLPDPPRTPEGENVGLSFDTPQSLPSLAPDSGDTTPQSNERHLHHRLGRQLDEPSSPPQDRDDYSLSPLRHRNPPKFRWNTRHEANSECVFCGVGPGGIVNNEPVRRLQCGHYSHEQCLYRLYGTVKELGDFDVLCSMCENPASVDMPTNTNTNTDFTAVSDFAPGFRHGVSTPVSNGSNSYDMTRSTSTGSINSSSISFAPLHTHRRQSQSSFAHALNQATSLYQSVDTSNSEVGLRSPMLNPSTVSGASVSPLTLHRRADSDSTSVSTGRVTLLSSSDKSPGDPQASFFSNATTNEAGCQASESPVSSPTSPSKHTKTDFGASTRKEIKSLLSSEHALTVECSPNLHPFRVISAANQPNKGVTHICVAIDVEPTTANYDVLSGYRSTAKDIHYATKIRQQLADMQFDFGSFHLPELPSLRLHSRVSVSNRDCSTVIRENCDAYLFEGLLIVIRNSAISAVVPLKCTDAHIEASRPTTVELIFHTAGMPNLNLHTASPAAAHMWKHAFQNPKAQFPLAPGKLLDDYASKLESYIENSNSPKTNPFVPAEIILCLPVSSQSQALTMQQTLRAAVNSLSYRDKLGLIVYNKRGIEHKIPLASPFSEVWVTALEEYKASEPLLPQAHHFTLDDVLTTTSEMLSHQEPSNATASVILVGDDDDLTMQTIPASLSRARVPVHTIGLHERHDAFTLSKLPRQTRGSYHYVKSIHELDELLSALVESETRYTHKNVVMRLKPRIGTRISGVIGGSTAPSIETSYAGVASTSTRFLEGEPSILEWQLGSMRMDDIRDIEIEVSGDVPLGSSILQVVIEATHFLHSEEKPCTSTFRVPVNVVDDERLSSMVISLSTIESVLPHLEQATINLLLDNSRVAYDQLLSGLQRIQSVQKSGKVAAKAFLSLLDAYEWLFDLCCDDIVKSPQRTKGFMLELLQRVWVLHTKRSFLKRDPIEIALNDT